jgi:two-component system, NarL family, sensor histidine kinase UhpB
MTLKPWKNWRIVPQVIFVTTLPVLLMFITVVIYSYYSRSHEVIEELQERGQLTAAHLVDLSVYALYAGDDRYLAPALDKLITTDPSIVEISIKDAKGGIFMHRRRPGNSRDGLLTFVQPVTTQAVEFDNFADASNPHTDRSETSSRMKSPNSIGQVLVLVSPEHMLNKQKHRIFVGATIAAVTLIISLLLGLALASGITKPLTAIINTVRRIRSGDFTNVSARNAVGEIGELESAIADMATSIAEGRLDLENKVKQRTAEIRRLLDKVNNVAEEERRFLSRELHDHLNAELIVVRLEAQHILALIEGREPLNRDDLHTHVTSITKLVAGLYNNARSIVRRLRPEILEALGLQSAIEEVVRSYDDTQSGCAYTFISNGDFSNIDDEIGISIYRITQEALANVSRHANAKHAYVELAVVDGKLSLTISDDGTGFDLSVSTPGLGVMGMRERVQSLGGNIEIDSSLTNGTTIFVNLPKIVTAPPSR